MITALCFMVTGMIVGFCIVFFGLLWRLPKEPPGCRICGGQIVEYNKKLQCEFCGEQYDE